MKTDKESMGQNVRDIGDSIDDASVTALVKITFSIIGRPALTPPNS